MSNELVQKLPIGLQTFMQIKEKRYYEKHADGENQKIYLIGEEFSAEERNTSRFEWESLPPITSPEEQAK